MSHELHLFHEQSCFQIIRHPPVSCEPVEEVADIFCMASDKIFFTFFFVSFDGDEDVVKIRAALGKAAARRVNVTLEQLWPDVDPLWDHPPLPQAAGELNVGYGATVGVEGHLVEGVTEVDGGKDFAFRSFRYDPFGEGERIGVLLSL